MRVLVDRWLSGYLDYHRRPPDVRIQVEGWAILEEIEDQYFVAPRDWRQLWGYLRRLGIRAAWRKFRSRLRERRRNEKFVSVGVGEVLEVDRDGRHGTGDRVLFLAYNHPRCADRIAIDARFAVHWPHGPVGPKDRIFHMDLRGDCELSPELRPYRAWSPHSGRPVKEEAVAGGLREMVVCLRRMLEERGGGDRSLLVKPDRPVRELSPASGLSRGSDPDRLSAVLFGLGHYAKTHVIPNLMAGIEVVKIHEIDPLQIGPADEWSRGLDTSPNPRPGKEYDVYLIAGYHHTHAPLAVEALKRSAYAVVEKPLVTNRGQLEELRRALSKAGSGLFACFHKRYAPFNDWVREDLAVSRGEAVDYHCIVYEVPLPEHHWYRWPTSGSRLVSNGCHWIDHFMYLNEYAPPKYMQATRAETGTVAVFLELENGAVFSMTLTDVGSGRLGVRDYVELRAGARTVRMVDGAEYEAEDPRRILRRKRCKPTESYGQMYQDISRCIVHGGEGDSPEALRSTEVMLALEEQLDRRGAGAGATGGSEV